MTAAIEAHALTKTFGTRKALDYVSFELPEGAFLSIFGPNGAGKSTLLRTLATLQRPSSGTASVAGFDIIEQADELRAAIGVVSHAPMLYPDLSAEQNLMFYARLYGVANPKARVMELLELVGLRHRRLDAVRGYSRGMTQRLAIARALVHDPQVVFLDEPYSGLDPHAIRVFDALIESLRGGRSFCMVSHDLEKGLQLATHVLVLAKGRVVAFDETGSLDVDAFQALFAETVGCGVA